MGESERQIVSRILNNDRDAFRLLIEQYQHLVMHVVCRMVQDSRDREELTQDVFLKVHKYLKGFRHESKLSTWIARIAYNSCLSHLEKTKLLLYEDEAASNEWYDTAAISGISNEDANPEELMIFTDTRTVVHKAVEQLPVILRTVLTLFYLDEMSVQEIAEVINAPTGTVKSYLFRGRKQLKEYIIAKYKPEILPT